VADAIGAGPPVDRVLVTVAGGRTSTPEETTPAGLVDLVRTALGASSPGASFVGGTEIYFTELNRTRPDHTIRDGICYSASPQIHAFTDIDVVREPRRPGRDGTGCAGDRRGKPVIVSPITLRRRVTSTPPATRRRRLPESCPDSVDVRQSALYGSA
jgi:hypothetical protein